MLTALPPCNKTMMDGEAGPASITRRASGLRWRLAQELETLLYRPEVLASVAGKVGLRGLIGNEVKLPFIDDRFDGCVLVACGVIALFLRPVLSTDADCLGRGRRTSKTSSLAVAIAEARIKQGSCLRTNIPRRPNMSYDHHLACCSDELDAVSNVRRRLLCLPAGWVADAERVIRTGVGGQRWPV